MTLVIVASLAMVVLGVLFGICLALASRVFAKDEDPRVEEVLVALPGLNCAACAFSGCRAYAEAVAAGDEDVNLCRPGGPDTAEAVAAIMGVQAGAVVRLRAVVHCQGGESRCGSRAVYDGPADCRAADLIGGGHKDCPYGCLGFGTCAEACPFGAITMSAERLPVVDAHKCTACGACVDACPRGIISLLDVDYKTYLGCAVRERGKLVKEMCSVGCIACGACAKKDPNGAIVMEGNLPVLDYEKSGGDFDVAVEVCPMNCFVSEGGKPELVAAAGAASGAGE